MKKARKARAIAIPNGWQGRNGFPRGVRNRDSKIMAFAKLVEQTGSEAVSSSSMELDFYHAHFSAALAGKNRRYTEKDRSERVQTVEDVYDAYRTAPEEIIWKLDAKGQEPIDQNLLEEIFAEHFDWEKETFPQAHYFSHVFHRNAPAAPDYVQARRIWIAHDKEGNEIISERKALREMGIERPDASQKDNRYNNAKMTHTTMCRTHLEELFVSRGLAITVTLWKRSGHGLKALSPMPRT